MAEFYFKPPDCDRRNLRNNSNFTALSSNKNNEFKVPRIPSKYTAQNYNQPVHNVDSSALQLLKPIGDKFEVIDKLRLVPIEEIKQISSEFIQKLDSLCMDKITKQILQTNSNAAPSVVNDGVSAFHTIISQAPTTQPSMKSCQCQASTCSSEIGYPPNIPSTEVTCRPASQKQQQSKVSKVPANDDDNESIVSFFKKNQSCTQSTKSTFRKFLNDEVTTAQANPTVRKIYRSQSVEPSLSSVLKHRPTQTKQKSVARSRSKAKPNVDGLHDSALTSKVAVIVNQVSEKKNRSAPTKRKITEKSSYEPKRKSPKSSVKAFDGNITKDSLRSRVPKEKQKTNDIAAKQTMKKKSRCQKENRSVNREVVDDANNVGEPCGYEHTGREMFCDISSIVDGISIRESPNNAVKTVAKVSATKNDVPLHFFSPFANVKSMSGFSAISTPLSKTVSKDVLTKRLKKPNVAAELKTIKSKRKPRAVEKDIRSLNESVETELGENTSDFSDMENTEEY